MTNRPVLDADLHAEDNDGNSWTLLQQGQFDPTWVYPGAFIRAGRAGVEAEAQVLRTELHLDPTGTARVLVTFRQTAIRSLHEALETGPSPEYVSGPDLPESLARAVAERDEARAWARAEYHQAWDAPYVPDNYPDWLTRPA